MGIVPGKTESRGESGMNREGYVINANTKVQEREKVKGDKRSVVTEPLRERQWREGKQVQGSGERSGKKAEREAWREWKAYDCSCEASPSMRSTTIHLIPCGVLTMC